MVTFTSEKLSETMTRIYATAGEVMFLIEGRDRAVLVDSGTGVGDLRSYVESLTKLPVTVLVTHGHGDHALGAVQFDDIYMSRLDHSAFRARCQEGLRREFLKIHNPGFAKLEERDYMPIPSPEAFQDLKDGAVFELGGVTLETVQCGGHTPGSMMILNQEERSLITGDACNYFTMLHGAPCLGLSSYERNLRAARERTEGRYDRIYLSHGKLNMPLTLMEEVLEVCREIKEGTDDKIPFGQLDQSGLVAKAYGKNSLTSYGRLDGKWGNIVYNPARIWE